MRVTVDGRRVEILMNRSVQDTLRDSKLQREKAKHINATTLNSYLDMCRGKVQTIFNQLNSTGENLTAVMLKRVFKGKEPKEGSKQKTIVDAFIYHNLKMEEMVNIGKVVKKTLERYIITKNKVVNFMKHQYKITDQSLPEMRRAFVTEFEHYLLTVEKIQRNTAHKYIKNLKKIMNMAVALDWITTNPFNSFKCSYTSPEREILNQEEIEILIQKNSLYRD